jgi:hypothetical protein
VSTEATGEVHWAARFVAGAEDRRRASTDTEFGGGCAVSCGF